jgi:(S)-ureidoglycine aminohydrolase
MHSLGHTRSANRRDHLLHTPDAFVRTPLPGLAGGTAIVHISPAAGAAFTQFTVELEAGGTLAPAATQRFVYVLSGEINLSSRKPSAELSAAIHGLPARLQAQKNSLTAGRYAYFPPASSFLISARKAARLAVIEKPYQPLQGAAAPQLLIGREADVAPIALNRDPDLQVRALLPDSPAFNFAVNTMAYQPGASLSQVEVHVMEHGLLMLEGGGIYRLGDAWYSVTAGDFIWMAPFCPQWFGALGKAPAKYLIYKDWNRHPLG